MARRKAEHNHCDCERPGEIELPCQETTPAPLDTILSNISISQQPFSISDERINGILVD
jgi:hypothetical protein